MRGTRCDGCRRGRGCGVVSAKSERAGTVERGQQLCAPTPPGKHEYSPTTAIPRTTSPALRDWPQSGDPAPFATSPKSRIQLREREQRRRTVVLQRRPFSASIQTCEGRERIAGESRVWDERAIESVCRRTRPRPRRARGREQRRTYSCSSTTPQTHTSRRESQAREGQSRPSRVGRRGPRSLRALDEE